MHQYLSLAVVIIECFKQPHSLSLAMGKLQWPVSYRPPQPSSVAPPPRHRSCTATQNHPAAAPLKTCILHRETQWTCTVLAAMAFKFCYRTAQAGSWKCSTNE